MKKILAILLAAIMTLSLGVMAFAEGEGENTGILLPDFPTQTEGEISFASENTRVEAGQIVDIPVYIVSNYTSTVAEPEYIVVGMNLTLIGAAADQNYMTITAITPSAEVQALAGYELIGCDVVDMLLNTFNFKCNDTSILNQEKMLLATVTVEVSADYPGYNEDGTEMDCQLEISAPNYDNYRDNPYATYAYSQIEICNDTTAEYDLLDIGGGVVRVVAGHIIQTPPVPTWEERLKAWAIEQAIKIITFFQGLNEVLLGLLPTL